VENIEDTDDDDAPPTLDERKADGESPVRDDESPLVVFHR
jgi:hypothetical protein